VIAVGTIEILDMTTIDEHKQRRASEANLTWAKNDNIDSHSNARSEGIALIQIDLRDRFLPDNDGLSDR
jgi:hypothetical protein